MLDRLDPKRPAPALRNQKLMGWGRALTSVAGAWLGLGGVADAFWERMKADPKARNQR